MAVFVATTPAPPTEDYVCIAGNQGTGHVIGKNGASLTAMAQNLLTEGENIKTGPRWFRTRYAVQSVTTGSTGIQINNLDNFDQYVNGFLDGASIAEIWRVVGGVLTNVGSASITNCVCRPIGVVNQLASDEWVPAGTTHLRVRKYDWQRRGVTEYLGVASVDSSGQYSAFATVSVSLSSTQTGGDPAGNVITRAVKFSGETGNFTVGQVVTAAPSGATGTIEAITDSGTSGILLLSGISGTFSSNDTLSDPLTGAADCDGYADPNGSPGDGAYAAPTGFASADEDSGDTKYLTWNAVAGASGYIVRRSQYSQFDDASYIDTDGATAIQAGDMLVVDKQFPANVSKGDIFSDRVWTTSAEDGGLAWKRGHFYHDDSDLTWTFGEDNGRPYVSITNPTGSEVFLDRVTHGGNAQSNLWYTVLVPGRSYRHTVVARSSTADALRLVTPGVTTGGNQTLTLTSSFAEHTADFSRSTLDTSSTLYTCQLGIKAGATVDIKRWATHEAECAYYQFTSEAKTVLAHGTHLRQHDTGRHSWQLERYLPVLHDFLTGHTELTTDLVWIQPSDALTYDEWQGLINYLCGTSGTNAQRRIDMGQTTPWDQVYSKIRIEPGNEAWGGTGRDIESISGETLGDSQRLVLNYIVGACEAATDWNGSVIEFYNGGQWAGGWGAGGYNAGVLTAGTKIKGFGFSDYWPIGAIGTDNIWDEAVAGDWENNLGRASLIGAKAAAATLYTNCQAVGVKAIHYECAPNYSTNASVTNRLNHSRVAKSKGGGTSYFCNAALQAAQGVEEQCHFEYKNLEGNLNWASNSLPFQGFKMNGPWLWAVNFWNEHLAGCTAYEVTELVAPTATMDGTANQQSFYAVRFDKPGKSYIACFNLDTTQAQDVLFSGNLAGTTCTRHYLTGTDYKTHNTTDATKDDMARASEALGSVTLPLSRTIPAGEAEVYEFS